MFRTTKYSPPEDLCMQFYGTFACIHTSSLIDVRLKFHKTSYINLPEDEHLDCRNMWKTTNLN